MLSCLNPSAATPQAKFAMFCGENSANAGLARTSARSQLASLCRKVAHAQVTSVKSSAVKVATPSMA